MRINSSRKCFKLVFRINKWWRFKFYLIPILFSIILPQSTIATPSSCFTSKDFEDFLHQTKWVTPASGKMLVSEIRNALNRTPNSKKVSPGDNIAFAEFKTPKGESDFFVGISGQVDRPGTVTSPTTRKFNTSTVGHSRSNDSEVKILETLATKLKPNDQGTLNLYSERPICASCQNVVRQFKEQYPNVKIQIHEGSVGK